MICYTNEMSAPQIGSPVLDCKYNRITAVKCRRVVVLAFIKTGAKIYDDH